MRLPDGNILCTPSPSRHGRAAVKADIGYSLPYPFLPDPLDPFAGYDQHGLAATWIDSPQLIGNPGHAGPSGLPVEEPSLNALNFNSL